LADKPFLHTVQTSFHMHTSQEMMHEIVKKFERLGQECGGPEKGILFWKVGLNTYRSKKKIDEKPLKRVDMVQVAIFRDDAAFQQFRMHPTHVELKEKLKMLADWAPGDLSLNTDDLRAFRELLSE
jgi:hypothetical protein